MVFNVNGEGFSFSSAETRELLLQPLVTGPNVLSDFFKVYPNVKREKTLHHLKKLEKILQANTGCGFNASGTQNIVPRTITVNRLKAENEQCSDEFWDTIYEEILGNGIDINKLDATAQGQAVLNAMTTMIRLAIMNDKYLLAFLGEYDNEGASTTPSWYGSKGTGILQKIEDAVAIGDVTLVDDGGSDYSGAAMTTDHSQEMLRGCYENASEALRAIDPSQKRFYVTSDVYDYNIRYHEALGTEIAHVMLREGFMAPTYRGIPIIRMPHLQAELAASGQFNITSPHRVIYTVHQNLAIATDINDDQQSYETWYDIDTEMHRQRAKFKMGADYTYNELIVYSR